MKIHAAVISHVGMIRENNEDNFYLQGAIRTNLDELQSRTDGTFEDHEALLAVADGMGGMAHGELASLAAVQALRPCSLDDTHRVANECISHANGEICRVQVRTGRTMGTTLAALYLDHGRAIACNVGDSPIYLLREGVLHKLTIDHNQAQMMVDLGLLTPDAARQHPCRHALTQFIGIPEEKMVIQPHFSDEIELHPDDRFLLCSDGLTDMVDDQTIGSILASGTPEKTVQHLVERALAGGGRDNVTVLVAVLKNN